MRGRRAPAHVCVSNWLTDPAARRTTCTMPGTMTRRLVLVVAVLLSSAGWALAQPPSIHYVYDALNRLTAVVDQQGQAATYTYDAVGNILRIDRLDPPAGVVA